MSIWLTLYVVIAVLLLFGAAIFVHEFGHYWVARKRGLKVEAFAIGFGPKIFAWTRDGIEYSWRWIPAGGFVKLPQMVTSETLEGDHEKQEPLPPVTPLSKILVAFAGPFMNVVLAFAIATLLYFTGLPVKINPSIIGYVAPDSAEAKLGIKAGDRVVSVNGVLVKSWEEVFMQTVLTRADMLPVVIERAGTPVTYQLPVTAHKDIGLKTLNLEPRDHPTIKGVIAGGAAEKAGLKANDEVLEFAGVPIVGQRQMIEQIKQRPGEACVIVVKRGPERVTLTVTPVLNPATKDGRIGVEVGSSSVEVYQLMKPGPKPWELVGDVLNQMAATIGALVHSKETGVGAKDLSGPVGILGILGVQVATDYRLALKFLVLLNINLAILNLLPIPVLDGGHIVLSLIEKIRRRPVSARLQEYATTAFAVLLISFMLYVTFFDLKRLPLIRSMYQQETVIEPADKVQPSPAPSK